MDEDTLHFYREQRAGLCRARDREAYAADPLSRAASSGGNGSRTRMRRRRRFRANAGRGFDVRPTDGSPELAAEASRRLGRPVETLLFHDLDKVEAYDGVWANACLLHVPRSELAQVLALIWRALETRRPFLRQLQGGRGRRAGFAQSLLQLSVAGMAARHLLQRRPLEFTVDREGRSQRLRQRMGRRCCSSWPGKASEPCSVLRGS